MTAYTAAILTVSDKGARGERQDTSGPRLAALLADQGYTIAASAVVPDEMADIQQAIAAWVDAHGIDLILTTGGTGMSPRDITPEATRPLLEREVPGIGEAMRQASLRKTPNAILSRGIAGIRKQSLIINLPGNARAAAENLEAVLPALNHGLYKLKGGEQDCGG